MRFWQLSIFILCFSCNQQKEQSPAPAQKTGAVERIDEQRVTKDTAAPNTNKTYSNHRFKDVQILKLAENKFKLTGKAQMFEAAFSWVIEDGHEELLSGHEVTDAGAPEFGNFSFTVEAQKKRPNSTLHLILFEASPKDGSRQYKLPIPLN